MNVNLNHRSFRINGSHSQPFCSQRAVFAGKARFSCFSARGLLFLFSTSPNRSPFSGGSLLLANCNHRNLTSPPSLWPGRVLRKYHYPSCSHYHRRLLSGICFSESLCSFERHGELTKATASRIYLGECVFSFQGSRQEKQQLHLSD